MPDPSEWAFAIARELQGQWNRNDEDVCSLTVSANIARALDTTREEGRREGAEAAMRALFGNLHLETEHGDRVFVRLDETALAENEKEGDDA